MAVMDRTKSVGASEVAAIMGLSRFHSAHDVWLSKVGADSGLRKVSDRMLFGKKIEKAISEVYADKYGRKVRWLDETRYHPKHEWASATPDFEHEDGPEGGDCKKVGYRSDLWGDEDTDAIPPEVICQANWQMFVCGYPKVVVPAFFGDYELRRYTVKRSEDLIDLMEESVGRFWRDNVVGGKEPEISDSEMARAYLRKKFPSANDEIRTATEGEEHLVRLYEVARKKADESEKAKKDLEARIKLSIGGSKGFAGVGFKATWIDISGSEYTVKREPTRQLRVAFK